MPTHQQELMRAARNVARYQATIRGLRKRIKEAQAGLRLEQKHLRALATMHEEQTPPSRLFGAKVAAGKMPPLLSEAQCSRSGGHVYENDGTCHYCGFNPNDPSPELAGALEFVAALDDKETKAR